MAERFASLKFRRSSSRGLMYKGDAAVRWADRRAPARVVLLPAHDKRPPFRFYSGLGKVQPMMKWVQARAMSRLIYRAATSTRRRSRPTSTR